MSKNNLQVYIHIVFSTKNRNPDIHEFMENRLFSIIWQTILDNQCTPIMINGMPDHIHILLKLDSKISLAHLLQYIKGKSSRYLNENYRFPDNFQWQRGYGAFSVSSNDVARVADYVKYQKQHHRKNTTIDLLEL